MNASYSLLPPELMATLSDEWPHYPQCHTYAGTYGLTPREDRVKPLYEGICPPELQVQDDVAAWRLGSCSSLNHRRRFGDLCHDSSQSLEDIPDLSHTPLSCDSSVSHTNLPIDLRPELDFECYVPDFDGLGTNQALDKCLDHYDPIPFSDSSFSWMDSANESMFTIHSPKPVFAYKIFEFDLDRSHSPETNGQPPLLAEDGVSCRKRRRDDGEEFEEAIQLKKRKMSLVAPDLSSLFPDARRDFPAGGRRCSSSDTSYSDENVFAMGNLLDSVYAWDDGAWSSLSDC